MERSRRRGDLRGVLLVVASAFCYGTVPVLAKLTFRSGVTLPEFLAWRFGLAAILLWTVVALTRSALPPRKSVIGLILMGAVGYTGQSAAFFLALQRIPASTTALLLYTYPAIVTLFAAALLQDRLTARRLIAIAIAFCGTSLIVQGQLGGAAPAGIMLALLSAIVYSGYILAGSKLFASLPAFSATATVVSSTAISYVLFGAVTHSFEVPQTATQFGWISLVAVTGTAIPIYAFVVGMPRIGPSRASILSTFEPVVTVLLATAILGEPFHALQVVGAALILGSVVTLESGRGDEPAKM